MRKIQQLLLASLLVLTGSIASSQAQTTLVSQNFDASINALPTGWMAPNGGWAADTSNSSTGYAGASGNTNLVIRNTSSSGTYSLITSPFSTLGYDNISIQWAARLTVNFPTNGSTVQSLSLSTDGGITWDNIPYTENTNNSVWSINNNGSRVALPATASNKADVRIRWTVVIATHTDGTYRIDDFHVQGNATTTSLQDAPGLPQVYCFRQVNQWHITGLESISHYQLNLYDISGKKIYSQSQVSVIDLQAYPAGLYFIEVIADKARKIFKATN